MARNVLVCGGAGYIGAHMCEQLAGCGHRVVVFDNLSGGQRTHVRWGELVVGDLRDYRALASVLARYPFDAVMHFAGKIVVSESVSDPAAYYEHNVAGTLNLLRAMQRRDCPPLVFSSTAAVYGDPAYTPIDEEHPCVPVNPYGRSKWFAEQVLADFRVAHGLRSVSLRYFNAAGATRTGLIGETHEPETHLIPNVLRAFREGAAIDVFGVDYPTPDGSCVRDFVHVSDLCRAHLAALGYLWNGGDTAAINLGSGTGHSVLEVIAVAGRICGQPISYRVAPRRRGDAPILVASSQRARQILGWSPVESDLETIIGSAWRWEWSRAAGSL